MSFWYPQCAVTLRVQWENYGNSNPILKKPYEFSPLVRRAVVNVNSYTEADTFEITLDYDTFPFDPRAIKQCDVSIHMEDMGSLYEAPGKKNVITPSVDNVVFKGFADQERMQLDDSARTITLKGRDYTSLFIDQKHTGDLVNMAQPVDLIIGELLRKTPGASPGIKLENRTGKAVLPIPAAAAPEPTPLNAQKSAKKNQSYWDVIQEIVSSNGLIAYVEIDKLVISSPRTLYDANKAAQLIYGKNVKSLEMTRLMGVQKGFNVVVRAVIGKDVEVVKIPRDAVNLPNAGKDVMIPKMAPGGQALSNPALGVQEAEAPSISFVLNVKSRAALIEFGEKIFEELGRQQLEGRITTRDMEAPLGADNAAPLPETFNLLKLRNGSPIKIFIDHKDIAQIQAETSVARKAAYLLSRGYSPDLAQGLATSLSQYETPFYTRAVQFSMDQESGFQIDIDFVNFIETNNQNFSGLR